MLPIVLSSFVGGGLTAALLWSQGLVLALVCAPLGGSATGLAAGVAVAAGRRLARPRAARPVHGPTAAWR